MLTTLKNENLDNTTLLYALRNQPPASKEALNHYLRTFYDIYLASKPIDDGNSCPLDFVWDVYSSALGFTKTPNYNILGMASRGSQKTLSVSTAETLLLQHSIRNIIYMSAIQKQADAGYDHFRRIVGKKNMSDLFEDPTMKATKRKDRDNKLAITIATMESCNSMHASVLFQDELDLTPKKIFDESQGMLNAELGNIPLNVCISSRKYAIGNVQNILDKHKKGDSVWKVHKWGILELTAKCLPERHGEFGEKIYVDDDNLIAISKDEYEKIPQDSVKKKNFVETEGYKNCLSCGIFSFCKGRLPNQEDDNPHLQPIEVTRTQFKKEDTKFFQAQRLNRKPSTKGLVYPMYDETIHDKTYAEMYEIFTGEVHPDLIKDPTTNRSKRSEIGLDELIFEFTRRGCTLIVGVDFGFSILAACLLIAIDGSGRTYVLDEITREGFSDAELAAELKRIWGHISISKCYADPESPGGIKEIRKATGWSMCEDVDKNVDEGVSTVRRKMRIPGTQGTELYISIYCTVLRDEIRSYSYKIDTKTEEPTEIINKKNDHCCDALRYPIHYVFRLKSRHSTVSMPNTKPDINLDKPVIPPSAAELAAKMGIPFNDNSGDYERDKDGNLVKKEAVVNSHGITKAGGFSV